MNTPLSRYCSIFAATFFALLFSVSGFTQNQVIGLAQPSIRWETDINAAFARAEQEQRPLFLHFIGDDCQPAKQMESDVFSQPNIVTQLNNSFVMVKINASENAILTQQFSVTAIPTDLIIKPNRQVIHRRTGGITAERFSDYLAYLQKTLQPNVSQSATTTPAADTVATQQPAVPTVIAPQQQIAIPDTIRDPFMQQPPVATGTPTNGDTTSSASVNQLRSIESAAKPVVVAEPAAPVQNPVLVPPPTVVSPSVPLLAVNEPAPPKTMVEVPLVLEGFCPVTLCLEERWISGNPAYCTLYQGHLFRFASANALTAFAQNPAKYIPIAMGEDIVLMVDRNKRVNGVRKFGACFQDRVFLFSNQESLDAFAARPEYYMEIALKYELARKEQPALVVY